jgi:hypothetical protein
VASDLERLANAVRQLADEAGDPMRMLASVHHDLNRLSSRASQLGGAHGARVQESLDSAIRATLDVADALSDFRNGASLFADRLIGGSPGGGSLGGDSPVEGSIVAGPEGARYGNPAERSFEFLGTNAASDQSAAPRPADAAVQGLLATTAFLGIALTDPGSQPTDELETGMPGTGAAIAADGSTSASAVSLRGAQSELAPYLSQYADEFVPLDSWDWVSAPAVLARHSNPAEFAEWSNDGGVAVPGRDVNCVNCAMAVESNWRGHPLVSAARATRAGEPSRERLPAYYGKPFEPSQFTDIESRLTMAGPGSSAIIRVRWDDGSGGDAGGHCFNAVNYQGTVYFIDGQRGVQDLWPPRTSSGGRNDGYGYPDVLGWATEAMYFGPDD